MDRISFTIENELLNVRYHIRGIKIGIYGEIGKKQMKNTVFSKRVQGVTSQIQFLVSLIEKNAIICSSVSRWVLKL